ncbi:hypothetical protein PHG31p50 [Aeromonas phage 31]|uniref:Uncharacterized protein n=4 Tax=Biquartavirus TaxID=1912143 RepID=Q6U9Q1_9CAUD|nr:hypothetical protein ST44RRORF051c [Aeromonas phage 44RR2.8t]YP_238779.1 hypothetical protein PHG31p50 [Aeromonas phage 31]APU00524.1 hypothetical protein [Aeromonas phage 44RR2.8t.2]APU00945.1 hypothetical protein [Aeromonas phage 31.2]APU02106.1 hypothetical protein [Aeromonas phage Riv-10]APU02353.1 hypothetical protein [Aeromonas phage SW69-9]UYD59614.1 hypothetical protein JNMOADIG_00085 [Aeromonas phage avDM5]UYD60412.1 hypothetical protein NPHMPGLK_00077 [Aeromonas phage avDM2]
MRNKCFSYAYADVEFDFSEIDYLGSSISVVTDAFMLCGTYPYKKFQFAMMPESGNGFVSQNIAFISADVGETDQYLAEAFTFKELRKIVEHTPARDYLEIRISSKKLLVNDLARILSNVVSELASIEAEMAQLPKRDYNKVVSNALRKITLTPEI